MAATITTNAVSRTLFKSLLRSARKLDRAIPAAAFPTEMASILGSASSSSSPSSVSNATSFSEAVKAGFRANSNVSAGTKEFKAAIDGAFTFLQAANKRTAALTATASKTSSTVTAAPAAVAPSKPSEVVFSVGQVFRHRTYGYKAVIIGWDATCKASPEWVASTGTARLPRGTNQPFYHCLVDVRDRPEAQVSYVAQDNIDMLFDEVSDDAAAAAAERIVVHPLAAKYFTSFSTLKGCFLPNAALQQQYPADDAAKIPASVTATANAASAKPKVVVRMTPHLSAAASAAPSAVRGSISDNDLILRAALRLKAYREGGLLSSSASSVSASAASAASASSSDDSEAETATMA
jgi:hemimethylated DNA binding protein